MVPAAQRWGAYDGGELVATAATFDLAMIVPGGATLAVAGLTGVSVRATHRRRGILRRFMDLHFEDARARGMGASALWSSERTLRTARESRPCLAAYGEHPRRGPATRHHERLGAERHVSRGRHLPELELYERPLCDLHRAARRHDARDHDAGTLDRHEPHRRGLHGRLPDAARRLHDRATRGGPLHGRLRHANADARRAEPATVAADARERGAGSPAAVTLSDTGRCRRRGRRARCGGRARGRGSARCRRPR